MSLFSLLLQLNAVLIKSEFFYNNFEIELNLNLTNNSLIILIHYYTIFNVYIFCNDYNNRFLKYCFLFSYMKIF